MVPYDDDILILIGPSVPFVIMWAVAIISILVRHFSYLLSLAGIVNVLRRLAWGMRMAGICSDFAHKTCLFTQVSA